MRRFALGLCSLIAGSICASLTLAHSPSLPQLVGTLRQVEREGKGNRQATEAWAELTASTEIDQLPDVLAAIDGADPLAANWLRAAIDTIAERHVQKGGKLPTESLEKFLRETNHDPRARRLAYEWLARGDTSAADRLIPQMLDDPSLELRREAVARVLTSAETAATAKRDDEALADYQKALRAARDLDQVKVATEALAKLGHPVDLSHHFGFLMDWQLIGPFSNIGGVGFDTAYPPETSPDLQASYPGTDATVAWKPHHTDDEYGSVDLNKAVGKHMGAVAYALTEFQSSKAQPVELRVGSGNAVKIWLNGQLLAGAEAYHANDVMDQYVGTGELKAGRNQILVKICQNEQTEDWAQDWKFQLRVCDRLGGAVLSTDRPPASVAKRETTETAPKE